MAANNTLRVTGLDFDTIREYLKNFISDKPEFKDYDFNSSALGTLLDLLADNTYYNAFYANMAVNEGFLDSAQLRDSVVSRAKSLGYTPRSARGATATVNIKFPNANTTTVDSTILIPEGQQFSATVNNIPLVFSTTESTLITPNTTNGFSANVNITEGTILTHRFNVSSSNTKFTIPNANVDTRFFTVTVQESGTNTVYTQASTLLEVNGNSTVYFLEETSNNRPLLVFGDNVLGKRPVTGSTVFARYRVVNAKDGNGANNFSSTGSIGGQSTYTIDTTSRAAGGAEPEDIETIRFNASKSFETQERAVTAEDYKRIVLANASDVKSAFVYGGQDASPPIFGKVYIAAQPTVGTVLSDARKEELVSLLERFNVQSIEPVFIDPTYLYLLPQINSRVDFTRTTSTVAQIQQAIASKVIEYENNNLGVFGRKWRNSKFLATVDTADIGIVGTTGCGFALQKRFRPDLTRTASYTLDFDHALNHPHEGHLGTVTSTQFTYNNRLCVLRDNGRNRIDIVTINQPITEPVIIQQGIGETDYRNGVITLNDFRPDSFTGSEIFVTAVPSNQNIEGRRNTILLIGQVDVTLFDDNTGLQVGTVENIATTGASFTVQERPLAGNLIY
jgi:hypothetical protein